MTLHFTQSLSVRRTGFGNTCMAELDVPRPVAGEIWEGSKLMWSDPHPYIGRSGWGNNDGSDFPEEVVDECFGALVTHFNGKTKCPMSMDYSSPTFWGLHGLDVSPNLTLDEGVEVDPSLVEITFEVDYDSTAYVAYDVGRVVFQRIVLERDGVERTFSNVACLPLSNWRNATATFRMWGQTYSWGSEGEKFLTIPSREVRKVI